jgi:hypothetical protein
VHFLLLPFLRGQETCQWIKDELFNNTKILVHLANEPNSLKSMAQSIAEFLKAIFSTYKFKAASGVLGKELIKKHLIKVDEETIHKRLEKPWKQLERCAAKSRTILQERGVIGNETEKGQREENAAKEAPKKKHRQDSKNTRDKHKKSSGFVNVKKEKEKEKSSGLVIVSTTQNRPHKRYPEIEDSAILASALMHSQSKPLANQGEQKHYENLNAQNEEIKSLISEMSKMPQKNAFKDYGLWKKSEKDILDQIKGWPALQKPGTESNNTQVPQQPNEWNQNQNQSQNMAPFSSLFSDPVPPAPIYQTETEQQTGMSYRDVLNNGAQNNGLSDDALSQQKGTESSASNGELSENFFPSAYDEPDPLQCLESFLRRPNDHGDTDQRPDGLPAVGIEQTYEYDDYRQDTRTTDCSASSSQLFSEEQMAQVYESNDDDYQGDHRQHYYPHYSNDSTHSLDVGTNNNAEKYEYPTVIQQVYVPAAASVVAQSAASMALPQQESCPDEFQWNWVPKSKRWREQLKKLVNASASEHKKKSDTYYLSFTDESMLVGESDRSKVTVGIHRDGTEVALKRIPKSLLFHKAPNPMDRLPDHINILNYKVNISVSGSCVNEL